MMKTKEEAEQYLRHHLMTFRRINLDKIDSTIASARGIVIDPQVDRVADMREHCLTLLRAGKFDAAMEAGQALFEAANGLYNALQDRRPLRAGRKSVGGADDANERKKIAANSTHAEWQKRADAKWRQDQHKDKTVRAMARLIAREGENAETIRRAIKKLA